MESYLRTLLLDLGYPVAWLVMPQGTALPYIILTRVSGRDRVILRGRTGDMDGRVQIDCFALSYGQVLSMSNSVRDLLSGHSGGAIKSATLQATRDLADPAGGDVIQRISLDFMVRWRT
jgi:hypothetical protein